MQSRRSRTRLGIRAISDLGVLDVGPNATRPLRLEPDHPLVIQDDNWRISIVASGDGRVEVRASGDAGVRVNEVQVRNVAQARAGDLISLPDRSLLVQHFSRRLAGLPVPLSRETFEQLLNQEVSRIAPIRGSLSVMVVRSRALLGDGLGEFLSAPEFRALCERDRSIVVGLAAPTTLELLCPDADSNEADDVRERLSEALGRLGRPFRWGWATAPTDALQPASLWGRVLDRLFGDKAEAAEDLPHADPVMVRLWSLCDVWAGSRGGVLLLGEAGSGRETLARVVHERRMPQAPFVVARSATFDSSAWRANVDRATGGSLYVRHLSRLPLPERTGFWQATAFRPLAGAVEQGAEGPPIVVTVPALRDRPLDVLPIAEHILMRCTGLDGSRKLKLASSARSMLSRSWLGSVRELKNALEFAALLVDASGEILPEHLISPMISVSGIGPRETDLRASLRSVERRTFLETLGRTNWNVTATARFLGLPRRTVVYRMSRLGIKRPTSAG